MRKERDIERLDHADSSVRLVSSCDKLHNARAILNDYRDSSEKLWERFTAGREGVLRYPRSMAEAFKRFGPASVTSELGDVVASIEEAVALAPARRATPVLPMRDGDDGDAGAQFLLAALYATGLEVEQDLQLTKEWLLKAAAGGDPTARKMCGYDMPTPADE